MSENDNHPQEYTPSVDDVREAWRDVAANPPECEDAGAEFDRFLAEVRAEAWDECDRLRQQDRDNGMPTRSNPYRLLSPSTPNPETEGQA